MKHIITTIFVCCLTTIIYAQNNFLPVKDVKVVENKILEASTKTKTIKCDFRQVKQLQYLSTAIESSGKFWFANGNKLRWEYTQPFNYIIAINNGLFTIKDEDKISVFDTKQNKAFKELNEILMSTVDGSLMSSGAFAYTLKENNTTYLVELVPNKPEMKAIIKNIHLYFLKSDLTVFKVRMIETEQDFTEITFSNKQLNTEIDAQLFQLD